MGGAGVGNLALCELAPRSGAYDEPMYGSSSQGSFL